MRWELPWYIALPIVALQIYVVYNWGKWYEGRKKVEADRDNF